MRLASQLTGLDIDIMTEADESARRQAEFAERTQLFMDTLDVDEMMPQLLVSEGFTTLEEVAYRQRGTGGTVVMPAVSDAPTGVDAAATSRRR